MTTAPGPAALALLNYQWMQCGLEIISTLWVMAFGACLGSLINVLVYRLPRGLNVVTPPSACPSCGTKLTWRENIPIFGWLMLRGRCRFCRDKISPEYPIVEAFVAVLFGVFYVLWYALHDNSIRSTVFLGFDWGSIAPGYVAYGLSQTWPAFVLLLILLASLVAMTIIDAKTFTIPLILAWVPTGLALVVHVGWALWLQATHRPFLRSTQNELWIIPGPDIFGWQWIGASIGAVVGLVFSNILLALGFLKQSFADYDQWEASVRAEEDRQASATGVTATSTPAPQEPGAAPGTGDPEKPRVELWVRYPHARREALRELLFLAPCMGLAMACGSAAERFWGAKQIVTPTSMTFAPGTPAPLWLVVLTGVLMGYLIGAGIVWAIRILGTLATGKEAMGLGDAHLLGAIGACLGWIDATLAFFGAAFVGLAWTILTMALGGKAKRIMPYGPFLAAAAILVLLGRPLIERGLTALFHSQPPIQLP